MNNEIKHLYPNAVNLVDYSLQDNSDGKGVSSLTGMQLS